MSGIGERKARTIVDALFGKPFESLGLEDIITLVEAGWSESTHLEFKTLKPEMSESKIKSLIIQSLVGFLNSEAGEGVLILGVDSKDGAEGIECVPYSLLDKRKNVVESKIRNWAFEHIGSIPRALTPPIVEVKALDCSEHGLGEGWLVPVYVKRIDDVLYYAKLVKSKKKDKIQEQQAYIRAGGQTITLSLEEILNIIEAKRQPKVFVTLYPKITKANKAQVAVAFYNFGTMPTETCEGTLALYRYVMFSKAPDLNDELRVASNLRPVQMKLVDYPSTLVKVEVKRYYLRKFEQEICKDLFHIFRVFKKLFSEGPLFPKLYFVVADIEVSFNKRLRREENILVMKFVAKVFTKHNTTEQECYVFFDRQRPYEYVQICEKFSITDYFNRKIFELSPEEALVIKMKGFDIETETVSKDKMILRLLRNAPFWEVLC